MITNKLDALNLNASKPSLNKKMELSSIGQGPQVLGFGEELAQLQQANESALSENISLSAENLPTMSSPNKVSEEDLKNFTENLNNFSGLQLSGLSQLNLPKEELELNEVNPEAMPAVLPQTTNFFNNIDNENVEVGQNPLQALSAKLNQLDQAVQATAQSQTQISNITAPIVQTAMPLASSPQEIAQPAVVPQAAPSKGQISLEGLELVQPQAFAAPQNVALAQSAPQAAPKPAMSLQNALGFSDFALANNFSNAKLNAQPAMKQASIADVDMTDVTSIEDAPVEKSVEAFKVPAQENFDKSMLEALSNFKMPSMTDAAKVSPEVVAQAVPMQTLNTQSPKTDVSALDQPISAEQQMSASMGEVVVSDRPQLKLVKQEAPSIPVNENLAAPMSLANAPTLAVAPKNQNSSEQKDFSGSKDLKSRDIENVSEMGTEANFAGMNVKDKLTDSVQKAPALQVAAPSETVVKENVNQVISHARTILSDGGGEMKIKMSPEGMGQVDLRVGVKNGLVNIAISTENEKVKKMFDESIVDIRSALETHNLKIDTLKVHVAEGAGSENLAQNQFNMSDKDFARSFMGQFRDERQAFRNQSMGSPMDRFRPPTKEAAGLSPSVRTSSGNSVGRLNIVA